MSNFYLPLMSNNIDRSDVDNLIDFLKQDPIPQLTNGPKVREFEAKWSEWVGVKYSLFVNSGSSANQLTMLGLRYRLEKQGIKGGEIIVPPLTWVSDVSSVIQNGFKPVFCDINHKNLSFDIEKLKQLINPNVRAIFVTHVLGLNALTDELLRICDANGILLIEDVCESHGATFKGEKLGSFGFASNFSYYFAHHMSTIEGGMICTNDYEFYQYLRAFRSHGMAREISDEKLRNEIISNNPQVNKDFIFLAPAYNFRSTEINAVLGLSQIKKLDANNVKRAENFKYFLSKLDPLKYHTQFDLDGQSNYAFIVILSEFDQSNEGEGTLYSWQKKREVRDKVESSLKENGIEFRRGLSGGGSQLQQPYLKELGYKYDPSNFPTMEHIHDNSWYIGNYPDLEREKIDTLVEVLNNVDVKDKVSYWHEKA
jgi:CDP-6-deoxy-D-xylo-4-hexulose-3-dehydrase